MSIRESRLPDFLLRMLKIASYALQMLASPDEIQPYPFNLSPAGRIWEKSRISLSAAYLCAISFPTDLLQASAESPTRIVHTPSSNVSVLSCSPFLSVRVERMISKSLMGFWKPVS